jgi:GNAT superfamily N-acetyltransferase
MKIRRALESEAPLLSALARESKAHWSYTAEQLAAWRDDLTVSPGTIASLPTYVAELDSGLGGFFVLQPGSPHWTLEHFWVSPSCMAQGVGRALLSRAVALATEGNATALAIDADPSAEQFYLACGARRVGSVAAPIEGSPDRYRPQLLLECHRAVTG